MTQAPDRRLAPLLPAGEPVESLLRKAQFFTPTGTPSRDYRGVALAAWLLAFVAMLLHLRRTVVMPRAAPSR